ncbi:MAG: response regulator transcription factor [Flavobacteriales bacterium]|jgi:two-component system response regulator|nr:response regulator transcription factor [Flavobacteriales bacterium]
MNPSEIKILLVDDEPDILELVGFHLRKEGYTVFTASGGKEGVEIARKEQPALIILDVMMPDMDGMETCEKIRQIPQLKDTLVTFLTALAEDYSMMAGFDAGADDYITKPVKPKVLVSKIKALLRRAGGQDVQAETSLAAGDLVIDRDRYVVVNKGREIVLPRKEFELLSLLTSRPGRVFKRDEIMDTVWGNEVVVGGRTIDVHIRKLREKIGEDYFKTIKGVGYKFEA